MTKYILVNEKGTRVYHLKVCAELYQKIYGGEVVEVYLGDETV